MTASMSPFRVKKSRNEVNTSDEKCGAASTSFYMNQARSARCSETRERGVTNLSYAR